MNYKDSLLISSIIEYEKANLKPERFDHCLRVAETSRYMCFLYGLDPAKGYFAGLAHDICKKMDDQKLISLALQDGEEITEAEYDKVNLLHGRAAAVMLKNDFNVDDGEILEAVARHTYGKDGLCGIAKVVFAADKIEPGRKNLSEESRSRYFTLSLDRLCLEVVDDNIQYLLGKGKSVAPATYLFKKDLEKNLSLKELDL